MQNSRESAGQFYQNILREITEEEHLISMVPVKELLRFGYETGLHAGSRVLDLCCGYGTVLKIWHEAFGIKGVGVDRDENFLYIGRKRLHESNIKDIKLLCADVLSYADAQRYDLVLCSETLGSIADTLALGEKFLKQDGILAYQKLYAKVDEPPQALMDFDLEVLPLARLNQIFNNLGYAVVAMASDENGQWERYVLHWSGKRDWQRACIAANPSECLAWIQQWNDMYFQYRRPYEGQALFGLQQIDRILNK